MGLIAPPAKGEPYPGQLPPVRQQWRSLGSGPKALLTGGPLLVVVLLLLVNVRIGLTALVLVVGVLAASATYVKNRTDRHNAAIERGEIPIVADLHFQTATGEQLDTDATGRLGRAGIEPAEIGRVTRFDGGWLVAQRNPRDVAVVLGDDGGLARFDPRRVTDLWAASEYLAGRGKDF